jgi:hypothetical protein
VVSAHRAVDAVPENLAGAPAPPDLRPHRPAAVSDGSGPVTLRDRVARRIPVHPSDRRSPMARWRARHFLVGSEGARRYLAPGLTLPQFFARLEQHGVPYAVLRWFENLPEVEPGEDVDLLVEDAYLELVHSLLLPRPLRRDSQPFDVYTVSGLPGSDFLEVPYLPPSFARELLAGVDRVGGLYRVPNPEHHFVSLAYHALYHKGYASGLRSDTGAGGGPRAGDHDYEAILAGLAEQLGAPMVPTLESLDEFLAGLGLRPPMDTLDKLRRGNPWLFDRFFAGLSPVEPVWDGLAVFVVRERAAWQVELITREIDRHGFEVLEVVRLDRSRREAAERRIRGGNWERGPWAVSGGGPAAYVIAYDVAPRVDPADPGTRANLRIAEAKAMVRDRLLQGLTADELYNPLHSSDNPRQSLEYLDVLADPELVERIRHAASALLETCAMPYPVVRELGENLPARRARVAVVDHPVHGHCACKIYRPGAIRYFERELRARTEFADLALMPGLLEHGENWLLTPLYRDDGRQVQRRMPFMTVYRDEVQLRAWTMRALAEFARALHERGTFLLDLSTANLLSDPQAGLKILDLEFLQEYAEPATPLSRCYTFRGIPAAVADRYDQPLDVPLTGNGIGNQVFHPAVAGLRVRAFLRPQRPTDELRRTLVQLAWFGYYLVSRPAREAFGAASRSRRGRRAKSLLDLVMARGRQQR